MEANLIKKCQPKYNIVWRDDKNYFYVGIAKEDLPRVFITHQVSVYGNEGRKEGKALFDHQVKKDANYIGPFIEGTALKKTLKILRKVFPYYTVKKHPQGPCPWCYLDLCPGPNPDKKEYQKDIKNLISILSGKSQSVLKNLKGEMENASQKQEFEEAAKLRDQIKSLEKILAHAKIFSLFLPENVLTRRSSYYQVWGKIEKKLRKILNLTVSGKKMISRIEAYDVSNIQGEKATGSMVVFINGLPNKNFYRRFKIKVAGKPNDVAMIKECLNRRLNHPEWGWPDLILIDGGKAQLNIAIKSKANPPAGGPKSKNIPVIALAKEENKLYVERRKKPVLLKSLPREIFNLILQLRDEAHRFAISYHKQLRAKGLLER